MRIGALRHRVQIEKAVEAQDSTGAPQTTWSLVREVWAEVRRLSGQEFFAAQQINPEIRTAVKIRYLAGVTSKMRVVHAGQSMNIQAVLPDERKRELRLLCEEPL